MLSRALGLAAVAILAASATSVRAQGPSAHAERRLRALSGTVTDHDGNTLGDAEIAVVEHDSVTQRARTTDNGRFRIDGTPPGPLTLRVRRVGFHVKNVQVDASPLDRSVLIALDQVVDVLDAVDVDGEEVERKLSPQLIDFYARARTNHLGYYIDEKKLADLHPEYPSDALRSVPGVVVRPSRAIIGNEVRIRGCAPLVWIDGLRTPNAQVDEITHGSDIAAIEVYESLAGVPAQFTDRTATCGTILIWLKDR